MFSNDWKPVRKISRVLGPVWMVKRSNNHTEQIGYFKTAPINPKYRIKFLLANELISCRLAKLLDLNVADVELAKVNGKKGIVSIVQPASAYYSWNQLHRKLSGPVLNHIEEPEQMLQAFVFDIWICNVDRHGGNIVAVPWGQKYRFYLIDHGLSLLGALSFRRVRWNSPYWNNVRKYNRHYLRGLRSYVESYEQLEPYVLQIQQISADQIIQVVDDTPNSILPIEKKKLVQNMLLTRQLKLDSIVKKWCQPRKRLMIAKKPDGGKKSDVAKKRNVVQSATTPTDATESALTQAKISQFYYYYYL